MGHGWIGEVQGDHSFFLQGSNRGDDCLRCHLNSNLFKYRPLGQRIEGTRRK